MIAYTFKSVTPIGPANVQDDGSFIQFCTIETEITGLAGANKLIEDNIDFTVPNSEMFGEAKPAEAGWNYIKNTLAPAWVADNYAAS